MNKMITLCLATCLSSALPIQAVNIIPNPLSQIQGTGFFVLNSQTTISASTNGEKKIGEFFSDKIQHSTGYTCTVKTSTSKSNVIQLKLTKSVKGAEAYELKVTKDKVLILASTEKGLFYGMQSFLQLLPPQIESSTLQKNIEWKAECVSIKDAPRFEYRGMMMDVCRHFMPVETVKKQIDILSMFKINTLHFHLTEDQGWRIEIKKYPELTNVGAWRTTENGQKVGGFYTQEQIKDLVKYASERYVTIIPELEIPGHELAAIAAIPSLSCRGEKITPRTIWGVEDIVMCPGKEETFKFLEDVIDEIVPLFPGKYFHIGGDECPRKEWSTCPLCQKRIKELGIKGGHSKEAQLQSYVVGRIEKYLNKKGKSIIGWDEILEGGNLNPTAAVMSWRGEDGGIQAAKAGHDVIMTPSCHGMYLDYYQGDPNVEPTAIGGYAPLSNTYSYDPVPSVLVKEGKQHYVKGVQGNAWTEYIPNEKILEYRIFPRTLAIAEVGWTPVNKKNFTDFARRLDSDASIRLQAHHINFHIPLPEQPGSSCSNLVFDGANTTVSLKTTRPETIVYTLDGTNPSVSSTKYTGPIVINQTSFLKAATLLPCGILSPIRTIKVVKSKPLAAVSVDAVTPGLTMTKIDGTFQNTSELTSASAPSLIKTIGKIEEVRSQTSVPGNVRNVKNYAAIATGYIKLDKTDIYTFSSNNAEVWIDGEKLIDNNNDYVKRDSRNDAQINLSKGLHTLKVVFLGGIYDGWPTYWDNGRVSFKSSTDNWKAVSGDMLFH